jgi:hypothetical protein
MEKTQFLRFKEDLKREAANQRELKNQRRTVRLVGKRTVDPDDAAEQARQNKYELDKLYVIYYILKHRIEVTAENKEQVIWDAYVKLHPKYKASRRELTLTNGKKQISYYTDTPNGRDYTADYAMCDLMKRWDKILKQYGEAE